MVCMRGVYYCGIDKELFRPRCGVQKGWGYPQPHKGLWGYPQPLRCARHTESPGLQWTPRKRVGVHVDPDPKRDYETVKKRSLLTRNACIYQETLCNTYTSYWGTQPRRFHALLATSSWRAAARPTSEHSCRSSITLYRIRNGRETLNIDKKRLYILRNAPWCVFYYVYTSRPNFYLLHYPF